MESVHPVRLLAISGSLRRSSSNSALVAAAARFAPADVHISIFDALGDLPPFNPDLDLEIAPEAVRRFRTVLRASDAVLISSPEYAHGVPGVLKNALDWVVGSGELIGKPIALVNTSSRATHAWSSLLEILTVMSATIVTDASIVIPLDGKADPQAILGNPDLARRLSSVIEAIAGAGRESRAI
jgi:NAD(P)H-dependent FMN reductase